MANWWDDEFSDAAAPKAAATPIAEDKKKKEWWEDEFDAPAAKKPFTGRGTIAARNAAAAVQPLSERGAEFQRYAAIDANTVPSLGTAESRDRFSAEVARKAGEMGINPELSPLSPEVRASMERVAPSGQLLPLVRNPGVVAAKFRQGWRGMDAGLAALEYNITGRITVGDNTGDALERSIGGGPTVLEGAAAEKYLRELSSPNADDSTARAFDTVSSMGTRAAANAFAQPESILSLAGGMFGGGWGSAAGMLPTAVKALGSEYQQNLKMGATHQAAFANALAKMGIQGGTEWLGGKYGGSGGPIRSIAIESGEEALAQVGGYGADALSGLLADNGTPFYEKIPKTFGKALEETVEAAATGGIAAGALRAITAAPAFVVSGAQAAQDLLKSKRAKSPSAVPRPRAQPMSVDNWKDRDARPIPAPMDITANISPATGSAATSPIAVDAGTGSVTFDPTINAALATPTPPPATSTLLRQIMTPEQLALHESLQDEAGRMKMLADIKADAEAKRAGWEKSKASMARNAEDRDWLSKNPITSHPMFGEIDKAVRAGATSYRTLAEKVPHLSSSVMQAAFKHLESVGTISPYVKGKKREVLSAPTAVPAAAGTTQNNIALPVQPAIQPSVQQPIQPAIKDNIVEQEPNVTLPEVGRIIARETEDVNTRTQTPTATVQTKTPKVREPRVEPTEPIRLRAPAPQTATLPPALAGAKPRYGFGSNNHQLEFASDVDRAAYVLAQAKPSKQDAAYLAFVMGATGMSEVEARAYGAKVREGIKQQAKPLTKPGTIVVPDGRAAPTPAEATVTPQEPAAAVPASPAGATAVEETVAPPVQAQTPVAEAPLPATIGSAAAPEAVNRPALDTWVVSADPEDVDIWKGTHDAHAKRNNVKPEDTYVGQVLRGITPTTTPTADDATFAEKMKLSIPEALPTVGAQAATTNAPAAPPVQAEVPVTGLTPQTKARRKAAAVPVVEETAVAETPPAKPAKEPKKSKLVTDLEKKAAAREAKRVADEETAKADAAREAIRMPSDAELVGAGLSPAEVTLLKKNPEQHRDVLDAVSRGEISTKEGMRPVTDADVAAAKTRPEKDKLQRLKDKYEQATDARRVLTADEVRNVDREAIAAAYQRIQEIAGTPGMKQHEAIKSDTVSSGAILQTKAGAMATPTTSAELAKKLEDQYVENYKRNHPSVDLAPRGWGTISTSTQAIDEQIAADEVIRGRITNGKQALEAIVDGSIFAPADVLEMARRLLAASDFSDVSVSMTDNAEAEGLIHPESKERAAGAYWAVDNRVGLLSTAGGRTTDVAEVIVHELAHAGTIRAMEQVAAGTIKDPELKELLEDMKVGLQQLRAKLTTGEVADPVAKAAYAAKNIFELVATVYGDARIARRMDTANVTIPRRGPRRGRVATILSLIKDFVSRALGMPVKQVEQVLLSQRIREAVERMSAQTQARTTTQRTAQQRDKYTQLRALAPPTTVADYDPLVTDTPSVFSQWYDRGMSLFRNRGNASVDAQAFIEGKAGLESAMLLEAEFAVEHVQRALAEANKGITKATRDMYNVNLLKYLKGDKTATLPAPVVTRLEALRKLIDDRSLALIALGLIPKDKIATVLENHGKWLHRDYQVFQLQPGRNNSPGEYREHHKAQAEAGRGNIVKENVEAAKVDMRLPSEAEITALAKDAKSKTSDTAEGSKAQLLLWAWRWQLNTEALDGKEGVVAQLKQKARGEIDGKKMDPEELLHIQATDYLTAMLDPKFENAPIDTRREKFSPLGGVYVDDTAISEDRTQVPQWLRNVWGEYKRWDTVALLTLETQAKIIAKFVSLSNYKTKLELRGKIFKATDARSRKGYALLQNPIYGPLNGYYIPQEDLWLIQSANAMSAMDVALGSREFSTAPFLGPIMKATRGIVAFTSPFGRVLKVMQVLASHLTAGINAFSTAVHLSGALTRPIKSARTLPNSLKLAKASSFAGVSVLGGALESNTQLHRQLLFLTSKNMLHDSVLAADTRRQYKDQLTAEINASLQGGEWIWNMRGKAIPWAVDRLSRFNSFGDEIGKHIAWAGRVEELQVIHPNMAELEVWELAAKHVIATMPSYMHAMPLARAVGASGVLSAYATFHTEMIRGIYNSMEMVTEYTAMGSKDARVYAARELASVGIRVAGIATLNSIIWGPLLWAAQALTPDGGDDEEEKKKIEAQREEAMKFNTGEGYEAIRPVLADYVQGHQRFLRVTEDGKVLFTNLQRFDPFVFGAMLEAAQHGDPEDFANIVTSTYADLVGSIPALATLAAGAAQRAKFGPGTTKQAKGEDMTAAGWDELGVVYTPGFYKTLTRTSKAADQGVELLPDEILLDQTGFTIQIFDPKRAASAIAADYDNTHSRSMRLVREQMKEEAETLDFHSATVSKFTIWERAQRKMNNLRKTGLLDEGAIYTAVKSAPMSEGITEAEMVGLVEGMFVLPKYSEQVEKFHKEALVKAGTDQAKLDKVNTLYQTYYKQAAEADKAERAIYKAMGVTVL